MRRPLAFLLVLAAVGWPTAQAAPPASQPAPPLWFYYPINLLPAANIDQLEPIWRRAARAGYSRVLLSDSKFCRLAQMPPAYFANVERVKRLAAELNLEIVPAVFPIGWSNDLLSQDPNLAAGLPVRDAPFVVQGGQARAVTDPPVTLAGPPSWKDDTVALQGRTAAIDNPSGNARLVYKLTVAPFRVYHVRVQIKTQDFQGTPELKVLAGQQNLQYTSLGVKPTQDWTDHHVTFNSLDNREVTVYLGVWGGGRGKLWWRDWQIEEAGLVNVLRRPGAPLVVRKADGTALVEGRDFEPVADPKLGTVPWPGEYEAWHEPPSIKTRLPDGTRLAVSFCHPHVVYDGSVMICLSEPKTLDLLRDHARRVHELFRPAAFFMGHDEIRVLNWDAADQRRGLDAGPLLAENVRACTAILRQLNPRATIYVWSDMFDPHHNARRDYYLVKGDLAGSWVGLDPSVVIANWNSGHRDQSLAFFAGRGHRQVIAGYYDAPPDRIRDWLTSAARVGGPAGIVYCTWQRRYQDLEAFAQACRAGPR